MHYKQSALEPRSPPKRAISNYCSTRYGQRKKFNEIVYCLFRPPKVRPKAVNRQAALSEEPFQLVSRILTGSSQIMDQSLQASLGGKSRVLVRTVSNSHSISRIPATATAKIASFPLLATASGSDDNAVIEQPLSPISKLYSRVGTPNRQKFAALTGLSRFNQLAREATILHFCLS